METRQAGKAETKQQVQARRDHYAETLTAIQARATEAKEGSALKAKLEKDISRRKRVLGQLDEQLAGFAQAS